jgi:hypothetical protein
MSLSVGRKMLALLVVIVAVAALALIGRTAHGQAPEYSQTMAPLNDLPNPFQTINPRASDGSHPEYFKMPPGRKWGSTAGVDIDRDGKTVWIIDRCGANSCFDAAAGKMSDLDPILHFDENGKLIKSFGHGLVVFPHGLFVDQDDNIWVTDGNDNRPGQGRAGGAGAAGAAAGGARGAAGGRGAAAAGQTPGGAGRGGPVGAAAGATKGHQVFKFDKNGNVLLTLGAPGGAANPEYFYQPNDVLVAPNGDIFVSEIHGAGGGVIFKFDKTGKFLTKWGSPTGAASTVPGELNIPHSLAMDSRGRLFVASRGNNRIEIFDQNGKFLDQWFQFSRPSGVFIDKQDNIYVADSESGANNTTTHPGGWLRGIRIGSAKDGKVKYFIPDPEPEHTGTSSAEGVAVDAKGNIYGAEVGQMDVKKYVMKKS